MLSTARLSRVSAVGLLLAIGVGLPLLLLLRGGATARAATQGVEPTGVAAAHTTTADCYATTSGDWSVVFAACAANPGAKRIIPVGSTVTLDGDVDLAGDLLVQGALVPNGKTVTLTGAAAQTLTGNPLTFYQLVVNKTAKTDTVTVNGNLKVTRKLTVASGRLISASDYEDVAIAADGVLSLTNPITIGGHFTNTGELVTNGQGITFDGGVDNPGKEQWLTSDSTLIFDDLTVLTGTTLVEVYANDNLLLNGRLTNYGVIRKHQAVSGAGAYSFGLAGNYHDDALGIDVITASTLAGLTVERVDGMPAGAPAGQATGLYWTITPTGTGYTANLTLPQAGLAEPLACRAVTTGVWDCGRDSATPTHVARHGVTAFSPWAVWAQEPTTTTLTTSANPAVYGATVTFTATVQPITALGSVQFYADGAALGTAQAIAGGLATYTSTMRLLGTHTVSATTTITGGPYLGSVAPDFTQVVQPLPIAVNDAAGVLQGETIALAVLANDLDPAGGGLAVAAITLQPAHGTAAVSPNGRTVVYTSTASFAGLDSFTYVAQDANGHTDAALVAVVVTARQQQGAAPQVAPVNPTVDSSAVFTSPQAQVDALLPANFVTMTLGEKDVFFLAYTPVLTPTEKGNQAPPGLRFGNFEFDLTAYLNNVPEHGLQFAVPVTISVTYNPALVGQLQEQTLTVYYWNGTAWVQDGITVIARDAFAHTLTFAITHLSDFAFFAAAPTAEEPIPEPDAPFKVYLPAVSRLDEW